MYFTFLAAHISEQRDCSDYIGPKGFLSLPKVSGLPRKIVSALHLKQTLRKIQTNGPWYVCLFSSKNTLRSQIRSMEGVTVPRKGLRLRQSFIPNQRATWLDYTGNTWTNTLCAKQIVSLTEMPVSLTYSRKRERENVISQLKLKWPKLLPYDFCHYQAEISLSFIAQSNQGRKLFCGNKPSKGISAAQKIRK